MKPTDNFFAVKAALAARILSSSLAPCLRPSTCERLKDIAAGAKFDEYSMISLEFQRADTSVSLCVERDAEWRDDTVKDEEGNEYVRFDLRANVNWPTHGNSSP